MAAVFWLVGVSGKLKVRDGAASPDSAISCLAYSGSPVSGIGLPSRSVHSPVGAKSAPMLGLMTPSAILAGEGAADVQADRGPVEGDGHGLADLDVLDLVDVDPVVPGVRVEAADRATGVVRVRLLRVLEDDGEVLGLDLAVLHGELVIARGGHEPLVEDLRVDAEVDLPLVGIGMAVGVARLVPLGVADEDHLAAVAGRVALDHVRPRGDRQDLRGPVGLARVGGLGDRREAEGGGVVEVANRLVEVEGDGLAVGGAGDGLVEHRLLVRGGLVGTRVLRGLAIRLEGDVEVRDRVGRPLVDDVGRERPRDAVRDVRARDRRAVLEGDPITQGEGPGLAAVGRGAEVGRKVRGQRGALGRVGRELVRLRDR